MDAAAAAHYPQWLAGLPTARLGMILFTIPLHAALLADLTCYADMT